MATANSVIEKAASRSSCWRATSSTPGTGDPVPEFDDPTMPLTCRPDCPRRCRIPASWRTATCGLEGTALCQRTARHPRPSLYARFAYCRAMIPGPWWRRTRYPRHPPCRTCFPAEELPARRRGYDRRPFNPVQAGGRRGDHTVRLRSHRRGDLPLTRRLRHAAEKRGLDSTSITSATSRLRPGDGIPTLVRSEFRPRRRHPPTGRRAAGRGCRLPPGRARHRQRQLTAPRSTTAPWSGRTPVIKSVPRTGVTACPMAISFRCTTAAPCTAAQAA